MFGDDDLGVFSDDMGAEVSFGSDTVKALFDRPTAVRLADQGFGGIEMVTPAIHIPYNAFCPMPVNGDLVTVNGVDYTVGETTSEGDGAIITYPLKAAS